MRRYLGVENQHCGLGLLLEGDCVLTWDGGAVGDLLHAFDKHACFGVLVRRFRSGVHPRGRIAFLSLMAELRPH